jgi:hypothetical protein
MMDDKNFPSAQQRAEMVLTKSEFSFHVQRQFDDVFQAAVKDIHRYPGLLEAGDRIQTQGCHTIDGNDILHTSVIEYGTPKVGRPKKLNVNQSKQATIKNVERFE